MTITTLLAQKPGQCATVVQTGVPQSYAPWTAFAQLRSQVWQRGAAAEPGNAGGRKFHQRPPVDHHAGGSHASGGGKSLGALLEAVAGERPPEYWCWINGLAKV